MKRIINQIKDYASIPMTILVLAVWVISKPKW